MHHAVLATTVKLDAMWVKTTDRDGFIGLRQHRNEHVDEYDHHATAVCAEHQLADKLCQVVAMFYGKDLNRSQTVHGEIECLNRLEQTV